MSDADQLNLYEACGLLLGCGMAPEDQTGSMLEALLLLPMSELQALCAVGARLAAPPPASTPAVARAMSLGGGGGGGGEGNEPLLKRAEEAAHRIGVFAAVSKGFATLSGAQTRAAFNRAMQLALAALGPFGGSAELRAKTVTLLHRMVEAFSIDVLAYLQPALPHLLHHADPKETAEVTALLNQLVLKFKAAVAPSISPVVSPLTSAIFGHVSRLEEALSAEASAGAPQDVRAPVSEEGRERRSLLRAYFSFLHALVHSELVAVLCDGNNAPLLDGALGRLLQGCVEGPDLGVQRQCFAVLQRLVEHLGGATGAAAGAFDGYVREKILPACFGALSQPHFNLSDAAALALLEAVASLQIAMLATLGPPFADHLRGAYLPTIGCSPAFAEEYARMLALGDARQFRDFLRQHMVRS